MSTFETAIRQLRAEMKSELSDLRKLIVTRLVKDKWVQQDIACALLRVQPRQLRRIRKGLDKNGNACGDIGWKKGKGKNVLYYLPDIEKYNGSFAVN